MREKRKIDLRMMLLSAVMAFAVWFVIVNIDDPLDTRQFTQIPVTVQNESIITNDGKMYQIQNSSGTVEVTVTARRSILRRIQASDITAIADVKNLQLDSLIPVTVSIPAYEGRYEEAAAYPNNIQITIEDIESKKLPITAEMSGNPKDGYFVVSSEITPDNVTVSGPASLIDQISYAAVVVNVAGMDADADIEGTLHFYNPGGEMIDESLLTTSITEEGVRVKVHVKETVKVPVTVTTIGEPAEGYVLETVTCEPDAVFLTGKDEVVSALTEITIDDIDITDRSSTLETVVDLSDYLPEGVSLESQDGAKILITAIIDQAGTRTIRYPVGSVVVRQAPDGFAVSYPGITEVELNFEGAEEELKQLTASDISAFIDLSSLTRAGEYTVPLQVTAPGSCVLKTEVNLTIRLEKE